MFPIVFKIGSLIFLASYISPYKKSEDAFNCPNECGKMPKIHQDTQDMCTAFEEPCPEDKEMEKRKNKGQRLSKDTRIVGGKNVEESLPWLVILVINGYDPGKVEGCGGSLINTRFVLTAAHCACGGSNLCTRNMEEIEDEPLQIKEDVDVKEKIQTYIGKASESDLDLIHLMKSGESNPAAKVYIHPKLSTSQEYKNAPDIMLVKLEKPIEKWTPRIGPICLAHPGDIDLPPCIDNSQDGKKGDGGCATIAGWGYRYDLQDGGKCMTNTDMRAPAVNKECLEKWTSGGQTHTNCTKENIRIKDLSKTCQNFAQELLFHKTTNTSKYSGKGLEYFAEKAPVVLIKKKKGKTKRTTCGKINFDKKETRENGWNGWCATKIDKRKKIKEYGFCTDKCTDSVQYKVQEANQNLLTNDECNYLNSIKKEHEKTEFDDTLEFCAGKKHVISRGDQFIFTMKKKRRAILRRQKRRYQGELRAFPTKYFYKARRKSNKNKQLAQLPKEYKFNWYLGGKDTCSGDSGGPVWRIADIEGEKRAVQIGVVSRGNQCAGFNNPGIYGRVKSIYDFVKTVIEKEGDNFCLNSPKTVPENDKHNKSMEREIKDGQNMTVS